MFHKVTTAYPLAHRFIFACFTDGEIRVYDMANLIEKIPLFKNLHDEKLFDAVKVDAGGYGISWNDDIDLSSDEIYESGRVFEVIERETRRVVDETVAARRAACVSQKQLEESSGVKQPVIARVESGASTPRLDTLLRILAPLGKTLKVVDIVAE